MKYFKCDKDTAIVSTTKGKVRGYEYDGVSIFKGIPYAKADRFCKPTELEPWEDVLDCTSYGYVCPLRKIDKPNGELFVPHRYWAMNEDCQNLNIWTPACDNEKRAVVVWLHGGGFESGSAIEQEVYDGTNMSKYGDVVVVSVNHRLNFIGYWDLSEFDSEGRDFENSENAGTADMIAALRWIRDNIEAFGGNPNQVTIMGQSGGGAKVTTLLQSPEADGLYHRGIIMSGNYAPLSHDSKGTSKEFIEAIMEELKINSLKELQSVKYDRFADAFNKLEAEYKKNGFDVGCNPCPNEHYVGMPANMGFREETKDIPLMIGSVYAEFAALMREAPNRELISEMEAHDIILEKLGVATDIAEQLIELFKKAYPDRHLIDLLTIDFLFRGANIPYVMERASLNRNTYSYIFNSNTAIDYERVPWHCFDINFAFHNIDLVPSAQFEGAERLQEQIFNCFIAFIKTGNPNNSSIPNWKPCTKKEEHVMIFDSSTRELVNYDHELILKLRELKLDEFMDEFLYGTNKTQH